MMNTLFDFDTILERRGTGAIKWDAVPEDTLPMWVADMDFAAPEPVIDALRARLEHPVFGYTRISDTYLDAFVQWQAERNGLEVAPDEIICAPGVMPAVRFAIDTFTEPGDRVVVQAPVYHPFYAVIERRGREIERNPLIEADGRYGMDLDALEQSARNGARMLLLCSPHNPVGRVWTEDELTEVARVCGRYDMMVVSDEIHSDIIMPGSRFVSFIRVARETGCRAVSLFAPSKTFNIAGIGSCTVIPSDTEVGAQFRSNLGAGNLELPNLLSMVAAQAAYLHGGRWLDALIAYLHDNYRFMAGYLAEKMPQVRLFPLEGTYIAWLDFRLLGYSDDELNRRLRENARIRLNEGRQFGSEGSGFQRLNFACPRGVLEEGLNRLVRSLLKS